MVIVTSACCILISIKEVQAKFCNIIYTYVTTVTLHEMKKKKKQRVVANLKLLLFKYWVDGPGNLTSYLNDI